MRRQRRSLRLLALIVGLSLVAASCGGDDDDAANDVGAGRNDDQEVPEGGNLTLAAEQEPESLDKEIVRRAYADAPEDMLMAFFDRPGLAVEFEVREIYLQTPGPGAGTQLVPSLEQS